MLFFFFKHECLYSIISCAQLAGTVCPKKAPKKARAHFKDYLERSLRPIQATQMTPGPFWTKKDFKYFGLQIKIWQLENYFPLREPHNSQSL